MFLLAAGEAARAQADAFILAPTAHGLPVGTIYPFLIKQTGLSSSPFYTMRWQQVFNSSLFTNVSPDLNLRNNLSM